LSIVRYPKIFSKQVVALTTDRKCDFFFSESTPRLSSKQKKFFIQNQIKGINNFYNIQQIHGKRVIFANKKNFDKQKRIPKADALVTNDRGVALAVRTADCIPLFLFDPKNKAIGVIHGGWKSIKKEIIAATIKTMCYQYKTKAKDLKIAFGPSIRACCFEVEKKFLKNFPDQALGKSGKYYIDLVSIVKKQLKRLGVQQKNIFDSKMCTCCDHRFFSYRRGDVLSGRIASVMMLV